MTSFQSSEVTELPVVEKSQLFAQRAHSACTARAQRTVRPHRLRMFAVKSHGPLGGCYSFIFLGLLYLPVHFWMLAIVLDIKIAWHNLTFVVVPNFAVPSFIHTNPPPPPPPQNGKESLWLLEAPVSKIILQMHTPARTSQCWSRQTRTRSVHLDAPGQRHGQQPVSGTADPRSSQTGQVIRGLR